MFDDDDDDEFWPLSIFRTGNGYMITLTNH